MRRNSRGRAARTRTARARWSTATLDALIEEALVDAYGDSEQATGFYAMLEGNLAVPFDTEVLGVEVRVVRLEMTGSDQIVAVCAAGKSRQRIALADLPVPEPPPEGWKWVEAYRRWAGWRR